LADDDEAGESPLFSFLAFPAFTVE
jgi:hypothetical protein